MSSQNPETREKIMRATWKLLEKSGGAGVRMSDIAKAAGISRQAVYLHFPTRAELLTSTARYMDDVHNIDGSLAASRAASGFCSTSARLSISPRRARANWARRRTRCSACESSVTNSPVVR